MKDTNSYLSTRLWLNCYSKFVDGQLVLTAAIHRREFYIKDGYLNAGVIDDKPCFVYTTVLGHNDYEIDQDKVWSSLIEYSELYTCIRREYTSEVLRTELREALEDYIAGGSGELPVHTEYGQTTHYRDLEPLERL